MGRTDKLSVTARLGSGLFSRGTLRRALVTSAVFATFLALFYAEENWRGKRAWDNRKRDLEARGAVLDWSAYIPPPVPDALNYFKAPGINESNWVGRGGRELSSRLNALWQGRTNSTVVANLTIVSSSEPSSAETGTPTLHEDDPAVRVQAGKLIRDSIGPSLAGTHGFYAIIARPLEQITPVRAKLVSSRTLDAKQLRTLFPPTIEGSHVQFKTAGNGAFQVLLDPTVSVAVDYLRRSDAFEADFDIIREALKRPYARIDCDYTQPALIEIPNFVTLRAVAQVLAERTKCLLLLGRPEEALRDVTLLHDICRITEAGPTGKPMTLVAAMINVAITGLYASTVGDGLRLHAWREPQLAAIQDQLNRVNLAPLVEESFLEERVHATHTLETMPRAQLAKLFDHEKSGLPDQLSDSLSLFLTFAPRGWFYQNMVSHCDLSEPLLGIYDSTNQVFLPALSRQFGHQIQTVKGTPYTFMTALFLPNFVRAWQTVAHNQTLANQALVACALERCRAARGDYPETLDELTPRFVAKLPHDLIGGRPLCYRRTEAGNFLLYSVGWNEKDDGGKSALKTDYKEDLESGDWVWQTPAS